ncbi:MAG: hypothetical protein ACRC5Q_00480 [Culicoidibacterales bacterium]
MFEKLFKLKENKTTAKTELVAGTTTFLAVAYIIAFIGLKNAGIVVTNPDTFVAFGNVQDPQVL